jgi:MoaA/NifB/PqqE/SkfB family radical SAM enzyme
VTQGLIGAQLVRTGYRCNNACRFCNQGDLRAREGDRPDAEVAAAVAQAAETAGPSGVVVLSGGEVTLRAELPSWVALARARGAGQVVVQSNGRMLAYRGYAEQLVAAGVGTVAVALHGHVPALHDWLTRVEGSHAQALRGIRQARRAGAAVVVNTVICRSNFRHLPDIVALGQRAGAQAFRLLWPEPVGAAAASAASLIAHPEMVGPWVRRALKVAERLSVRVSCDLDQAAAGPGEEADGRHRG